jgi:hypothetical protein
MKIELHRLQIGDSDDPEIIASFVLGDWLCTEKGLWCKHNFHDLSYVCRPNINTFGFDIIVTGEIDPGPLYSEFCLRYT